MVALLTMRLDSARDIVRIRQRTRWIASLLSFSQRDQTQIAAAVSEAARHALVFANGALINFRLAQPSDGFLEIKVHDNGPVISDISVFLASEAGAGLRACYRLSETCTITSTPERGTEIVIRKKVPLRDACSPANIEILRSQLGQVQLENAVEEKTLEDKEVLALIDESRSHHAQLVSYQVQLEELNKELADTNRGVIALNTELEIQAKAVREASDVKQTFLAHITHELRTPLNSIISMSRILAEGEALSAEGIKQLNFIYSAAYGLSTMVNDLLDNVKADAGKWEIEVGVVKISEVFDMLKAMFRPLMPQDREIELVFTDVRHLPPFLSDETKINQILRNFISNALKFTEQGKIEVSAKIDGEMIRISVTDSGIGISSENQQVIFNEFTQVRGNHQKRSKGTGLGLPLARKLAGLLGGAVSLVSVPGTGSTFTVGIPVTLVSVDSETFLSSDKDSAT